MPQGTPRRIRSSRTIRFGVAVLALALVVPAAGVAHGTTNGFQDSFEEYLGQLQGTLTSEPWEIKAGTWKIIEQPLLDAPTSIDTNHVLVQESKANNVGSNGSEPIAFVRAKSFRSFTAQVTAAMMNPTNAFGDMTPGSSVGIAFRAPLTDGIADKDDLYLFSAENTGGPSRDFPTGKAFVLWKRVARGYYPLYTRIASTWTDFSKPHDYKVVMSAGHIMAYIDGRLVIEHTDIPAGDLPTQSDPFPGLPFDQGAVGLRTSGTAAWFDNFSVVGNDAYEARANAFDSYVNYGVNGSGPQGQVRRGASMQSSYLAGPQGSSADTGYLYHDHDFDQAATKPFVNPSGGQPAMGAFIGASAHNGAVTSTVRLSGVNAVFGDPDQQVTVLVTADSIVTQATARCTDASSSVSLVNATVTIDMVDVADRTGHQQIGPIPVRWSLDPGTKIFDKPGLVSIVVHARTISEWPHRVEAAALKIVFPEGASAGVPSQPLPNPPGGRTSEISSSVPPVEFTIAQVVAGRYCA